MSEEKKESTVETKAAKDSTSDKPSTVETKAAKDSTSDKPSTDEIAKAAKESKASKEATSKAESAAKAAKESKASKEATSKAESAAKAVEEAELAVKKALAKANAAKAKAEAAAEEEYKAIAAEVKADATKKSDYTFKRQGEEIFRRDMGEPEFWLEKEDRFPRPILSADEQESLTRIAETPHDQTPKYIPEHVLSPEFAGVSNYERGVDLFLKEMKQKLEQLQISPKATKREINDTEKQIIYLESLHENFYVGMNVFRTAKGGRDKINA